jgi:hypothetical protein
MSKKKKSDFNDDTPPGEGGVIIIGGPPANLPQVISSLFLPAGSAAHCDDLISASELFDSVLQHCDASKEAIFDEMINQGFINKSVEGQLYWLVLIPD